VAEDNTFEEDADLMIFCILLRGPVEGVSKKKIAFYCCWRPGDNALCQVLVKTQMKESNPDCPQVRSFSTAFEWSKMRAVSQMAVWVTKRVRAQMRTSAITVPAFWGVLLGLF
jgi:hypothetical protein